MWSNIKTAPQPLLSTSDLKPRFWGWSNCFDAAVSTRPHKCTFLVLPNTGLSNLKRLIWFVVCTAFVFASVLWLVFSRQHSATRMGEIPSLRKHFNIYVQLSLHTTFLPSRMEHKRVGGGGEHRVAHEQVNWNNYSKSVPSTDRAGFPVALSCPQCLKFFRVWTLRNAETYFTRITQYWTVNKNNCSTSSAHQWVLHYLVQRKMLFRMSVWTWILNYSWFFFFFFY